MSTIQNNIVATKDRLLALGHFNSAEDMSHISSRMTERRNIIADFKHVPTALEIVQACNGHDLADIKVEGWPSGTIYLMKYIPMTAEEIHAEDMILREQHFKTWKLHHKILTDRLKLLQKQLEEHQ